MNKVQAACAIVSVAWISIACIDAFAQPRMTLRDVAGVWRTHENGTKCWGEYVFQSRDGKIFLLHRSGSRDVAPLWITGGLNPDRPLALSIRWQEGLPTEGSTNLFQFQPTQNGDLVLRRGSEPPCTMSRQ